MKLLHGVADDERPDGDLGSYVKELRNDAPDVIFVFYQSSECASEIDFLFRFLQGWHPGQANGEHDGKHDQAENNVGRGYGVQFGALYRGQFVHGKCGTLARSKQVQLRKDEYLADDDAGDGAERIERLCEIEPLRCGLFVSHHQHIGVCGGFQYGKSRKENEDCQQKHDETEIDVHRGAEHGRIEQERSEGVEAQP